MKCNILNAPCHTQTEVHRQNAPPPSRAKIDTFCDGAVLVLIDKPTAVATQQNQLFPKRTHSNTRSSSARNTRNTCKSLRFPLHNFPPSATPKVGNKSIRPATNQRGETPLFFVHFIRQAQRSGVKSVSGLKTGNITGRIAPATLASFFATLLTDADFHLGGIGLLLDVSHLSISFSPHWKSAGKPKNFASCWENMTRCLTVSTHVQDAPFCPKIEHQGASYT